MTIREQSNEKELKEALFPSARYSASTLRVVIAGGGTGGHLFPGIAVAQEFMARNPQNRILFVGTGKPFELSVISEAGFAHKRITAEGIKRRGLLNQTVAILKIPKGIIESAKILKRFGPNIVVGVGGYAAGPLAMAAYLLKIKIVLHEQNLLPGITNRILSRLANRVYVSFNDTATVLNSRKTHFTGNPVRKEILRSMIDQKDIRKADLRQRKPFTVLVIGGSQGAHSINMAFMEALEHIKNKDNFFFVHQTGTRDEKTVKRAYRKHSIPCEVQSFFKDMARRYQKADLVICRAGATTVAEITAIGKSVIFIPFPFAADNHQVLNARALEKAGAAEVILEENLSGKTVAERIDYYFSNPERLHRMAFRARRFGRPDAAADIVDDCYDLVRSTRN
jgi:UDP-N-acetylglucosamine--N-acetylmuramyl-(pentapeptide) pyrophosphoryl-undecaprenol N-acetylglucosamine transferase